MFAVGAIFASAAVSFTAVSPVTATSAAAAATGVIGGASTTAVQQLQQAITPACNS